MVGIRFTYYAHPLDDGRFKVNLYVKDMEPTTEETPYCERKSIKDAAQFVREIVDGNEEGHEGEDRMLLAGDPPPEDFPVFMFTIGVTWNRAAKCAHYTRVCFQRYEMDGKWNPIASVGMEQYDYTMGVLKRFEKKILASREKAAQP